MLYSYSLRFNISIVLPIQTILFCYFHMHRTFTDSKFFRSLAHSRIVVDDVIGNADGALLNIILHRESPVIHFLHCMTGFCGLLLPDYCPQHDGMSPAPAGRYIRISCQYQRVMGRPLSIPFVIRIWCRSMMPLWKVAAQAAR